MCFAKPTAAMNEKGIKMCTWFSRDGTGGAIGQLIWRADHKIPQLEPEILLSMGTEPVAAIGGGVGTLGNRFRLRIELSAALGAEQFRVNGKNYLHGPTSNVGNDILYLARKMIFNPPTDKKVRHTDFDIVIFDYQACGILKPYLKSLLPDFTGNRFVNFINGIDNFCLHGASPTGSIRLLTMSMPNPEKPFLKRTVTFSSRELSSMNKT